MRAAWVVGLAVVFGCNPQASRPGLDPPLVAAPADERDALWALAPESARLAS
jgi:hypothetical protein